MRIGYFGGSFDPPHNGHLTIARAAAHAFSLDRILFVPTGNQPLKPAGATAPYADRLAMVDLLCAANRVTAQSPQATTAFIPSNLESPRPDLAPNYTVDTLRHLHSTLAPTDALFVLTGIDAFLDLRRWRSPDTLLTLADWIVLTRPGLPLAQHDDPLAPLRLTPTQSTRVHLLTDTADPTSATQIRTLLQTGRDVSHLLPPAVLQYIQTHRLYRP